MSNLCQTDQVDNIDISIFIYQIYTFQRMVSILLSSFDIEYIWLKKRKDKNYMEDFLDNKIIFYNQMKKKQSLSFVNFYSIVSIIC